MQPFTSSDSLGPIAPAPKPRTGGRARFARAWYRVDAEVPIRFQVGASGWLRGTTRNLSGGGLLLCARQLPAPGLEELVRSGMPIRLDLLVPGEWMELTGQAIWGAPPETEAPWYRMGIAFLEPRPEQIAVLQEFLMEQLQHPPVWH